MSGVDQFLAQAQPYLQEYGYIAIFAVIFLESFGLPLPGESLLIASALLAAKGDLHIVPMLGTAWAAAVLGDNVGYLIGFYGGRRLVVRFGARVGLTAPRLERVESFFRRYGGEVVLVARFFVLLRQLNGVTAGTVAMPWRRFLLYNAIGAALWTNAWGLSVYYLGHDLGGLLPWAQRFGYLVLVLAVLGALALLGKWYFTTRRQS